MKMSVSRFPNATMKNVEELGDLFNQLIPNPDPAIVADCELAIAAYLCGAAEHVINMSKLAQYHKLDPVLVQKYKAILNSCT